MYVKADDQIKQEVEHELRWDTHVEENQIGVAVSQGVVTLTGAVSSYAKKEAAQEAAHRVFGVLDVANDIQVKLPGSLTRTDTEIAQAVRHALEWDVLVPDEQIHSTVSEGWVTLEGEVETLTQREDAQRAVRYLLGVRGVTNKLHIQQAAIQNEQVQSIIEGALERRADRLAERIRVNVQGGEVTLAGDVHSYAEKRAIIGAVSHAPGVHAVKDQLRIHSYA